MDGSSDAQAESGSWLRDAEEATGRRRRRGGNVGMVMSVKALGPDYYPYAEALQERGDIDYAKLTSLR